MSNIQPILSTASLLLLLAANKGAYIVAMPAQLADPSTSSPTSKESDDKDGDTGKKPKRHSDKASTATADDTTPKEGSQDSSAAAANSDSSISLDNKPLISSGTPADAKGKSKNENMARINEESSSGNLVAPPTSRTGGESIMNQSSGSGSGSIAASSNDSSVIFGMHTNLIVLAVGVIVGMLVLGLVTGAVIARIRRGRRGY
ncbi:hypothetical protein BDF22DRAFT_695906 [Syncephalis plumigaleata]|nr:hypothetical protein BDF22DRAFT_695906 [Syncephalis plumigaleata]